MFLHGIFKCNVCFALCFFTFFFTFNSTPVLADGVVGFPFHGDLSTGLYPKRESRAVWLTTLSGLDWPKSKANTAEGRERQKRELCEILDELKAININTILLQTRVRSSVIYPSKIEPWDAALTGQYGKDPGYDPLQFAIEECHKRGMELHAWVVTIPVYKTAQAKQMGKDALHLKHPKLVKKHNDQYYLDPGLPGTAEYLVGICSEIVQNYDVDGIHFDYIRYPENAGSFPDTDTYKVYGKGVGKAQWRRNNVTCVVRSIYQRVKSLKPWVRVSSSPVGKFRDLRRYSARGWNCYDAVYQDAQGWLREGIHDALYPMMYFKGDNFYPFAADWHEQDLGKMVAPGLGIYFLDRNEKNWPLSDITNELHYVRTLGLGGQCYFRAKFLLDNVKGLYDYLHESFYAYPALTPAATWLDSIAPSSPTNFRTERLPNGMERLTWDVCTDNTPEAGVRYNVYVSRQSVVDATKAEHLVAAALMDPSFVYNPKFMEMNGYHIRVTAMDRFGNESQIESAGLKGETGSFDADFAENAKKYHCVMPDAQGNLALPERDAEFYAVADLQGRISETGRYAPVVNVSKLPAGWYQVRTLQKKGVSHRVLLFWKR